MSEACIAAAAPGLGGVLYIFVGAFVAGTPPGSCQDSAGNMSAMFGLHGRFVAQPGQGDALEAILPEAAEAVGEARPAGCTS